MSTSTKQILSAAETATILEITKPRLVQFCSAGRIPFAKVDGILQFQRADVIAFKRKKRKNGRPKKIA